MSPSDNKRAAMAFCDLMFNGCRPREAIERYAGSEYIQHNARRRRQGGLRRVLGAGMARAHQRVANAIISNQNALREAINDLRETLLMLADRVVAIDQRPTTDARLGARSVVRGAYGDAHDYPAIAAVPDLVVDPERVKTPRRQRRISSVRVTTVFGSNERSRQRPLATSHRRASSRMLSAAAAP
jgi:hypothetical protein